MDKYYLKHITRTIKKRPTQPLLIVLILSLAFVLVTISLSANFAIDKENQLQTSERYGCAKVVITTNSNSPSRFLFEHSVTDVLDDVEVTGSFTMPFVCDKTLIKGEAVSFENVDDFFSFQFIQYKEFYKSQKADIAFISEKFAKENGLSVGDTISLKVFGKEVSYEIYGISKTTFVDGASILVDISSAVDILIDDDTITTVLPSDFAPYAKLYIDFDDNVVDSNHVSDVLNNTFIDYSIKYPSLEISKMQETPLKMTTYGIVLFSLVCSMAVVICCTYCLNRERAEVANLFSIAGYNKKKLLYWQWLEMICYAAIGSILGFFVSIPLNKLVFKGVGFTFVSDNVSIIAILFAFVVLLFIAIGSPTWFYWQGQKVQKVHKHVRIPYVVKLIPAILLVISVVTLFFVRPYYYFVGGLIALAILLICILIYVPTFYKKIVMFVGNKSKNVAISYGCKNSAKVPTSSNTATLILLIATVLFAATFLVNSSTNYTDSLDYWFNGDYLLSGGTSRVVETLEKVDEVENVWGVDFYSDATINGKQAFAWNVSDTTIFNDMLSIPNAPKGNEIIISRSYAAEFNIDVGETIVLNVGNIERNVIVREMFEGNVFGVFFDGEYFGISFSSYVVKGKSNVPNEELYSSITNALAFETISISDVTSLLHISKDNNMMYVFFGRFISIFLYIFAIVGVADNLVESYKSRLQEFALYRTAGMSKKNLAKLIITENLSIIIFVVILGIISCAIISFDVRQYLFSQGYDMFVKYK